MEADEEDVLSFSVFRDFQEIDEAEEAGLASQGGSDVVKPDGLDRIDFDLAVLHRVAPAHFDVRAHPDSDAAGDFAGANSLPQALGEHHQAECTAE